MPNMFLNTSLHKSFGLFVWFSLFLTNVLLVGVLPLPQVKDGVTLEKGSASSLLLQPCYGTCHLKQTLFESLFVCVPTFPGFKAPVHYTSTGLQRRGFPAGVSGSVLLLCDPVQNPPHFHLRFSGHQTQLAECSESCCDRMAYSMLTGCL